MKDTLADNDKQGNDYRPTDEEMFEYAGFSALGSQRQYGPAEKQYSCVKEQDCKARTFEKSDEAVHGIPFSMCGGFHACPKKSERCEPNSNSG
jgi:hypothetical protein